MGRTTQLKSLGSPKKHAGVKHLATSVKSTDDAAITTAKPITANKVKRRNRQGVVARRMAVSLRKYPGALLRRKPFANVVKRFLPDDCATENTHFISNTVELIRCALEAKIVTVLEYARLIAKQNGRILVRPDDVRLAYMFDTKRNVPIEDFPGAKVEKKRKLRSLAPALVDAQ